MASSLRKRDSIHCFTFVGRAAVDDVRHVEAEAHQLARDGRTAEVLLSLVLPGQGDFGLYDVMRLLRSPQGIDHDGTRAYEEVPRCLGRVEQGGHQETVGSGGLSVGYVVRIGRIAGQGHTDEVHQVVSRESQSQGKGAHQDDNAEDVHPAPVKYLHQYREEHEECGDDDVRMGVYPVIHLGGHKGTVLQPLMSMK